MAFVDRKLLLPGPKNLSHPPPCPIKFCISAVKNLEFCGRICVPRCPKICSPFPPDFFSPPPPPPPPPPQTEVQSHSISPFVIIIVAILGGSFLFVGFYAIILKYCSNWNSLRRRSDPQLDDTHEDFIDENHGPVIDHPIWFINTVGLQNSIINSITVCKYKKEEGLIEGTECSVCLNEFQDDETLRLLPKCSHAFHLPCIDTWLRSHTNCPLCRAPIVVNPTGSTFSVTERNSNNLDSEGETLVEIPENHGGSGIDQIGGSNLNEITEENEDVGELGFNDGRRVIDVAKEDASGSNHVNSGFRVFSDLTEIGRLGEDDIQPLRRSASMDSSFASLICSLANFRAEESEGSSRNQLVRVKRGNSEILTKQGRGNLAISKLMGSSSMRRTLQKGPISMKRSLSYGGKFLFRNSQKSILPL